MEKQSLQTIIEEIWPRLKRKHLYPEIPMPKVRATADPSGVEENEGVGLEMKQKQMTINPSFVSEMKKRMRRHRNG